MNSEIKTPDTIESVSSEVDQIKQQYEKQNLPKERTRFLLTINEILDQKKIWKTIKKEEWISFFQQTKNKTEELTEEMIEYYDILVLKIKEELDILKNKKILKKSNKDKLWSVEELVNSEKFDLSKIWNLNSILLRLKKIPNIVEFKKLSWLIKELIKKFPSWVLKKKSENKFKENSKDI